MQNTAAKRYAEALYAIARENNLTLQVDSDLTELSGVWRDQLLLRSVLTSPRIELSLKRQTAEGLSKGLKMQKPMLNLLYLLLDKGRIDLISDLAREFSALHDAHSGRVRAHCKTARPLTEVQLDLLKAKLMKITGAKEVIVTLENDPSLLAGFVVKIDGKIIDGSLKGKLQRLQSSITQ